MSLLAFSCPALAMSAQPYSFVLDFELPNAAVLNIAHAGTFPGSDSSTLLATTFAGFGKTPSAYIPDLASVVEHGAAGAGFGRWARLGRRVLVRSPCARLRYGERGRRATAVCAHD